MDLTDAQVSAIDLHAQQCISHRAKLIPTAHPCVGACAVRTRLEKADAPSLLFHCDGAASQCAGRWIPYEKREMEQLRAVMFSHCASGGPLSLHG